MGQLAKRRTMALMLLLALAAIGYSTYRHRFRLRAAVWHVLHGDSAAVAGYRISVPSHWFVEQSAPNDVHLWNTRTGEGIWIHSFPKSPTFTLALWSDLVQKRLNGPENNIIGKRELNIGGGPAVCFERDLAVKLSPSSNAPNKPIHLPSVECRSAGPLDLMFFGGMRVKPRNDYSEFYSLLASIRKISQ